MVEEDCLKKRLSKGKCFFRGGQPRSIPCDDALYKTSMEPLDTVELFRCPVQREWSGGSRAVPACPWIQAQLKLCSTGFVLI